MRKIRFTSRMVQEEFQGQSYHFKVRILDQGERGVDFTPEGNTFALKASDGTDKLSSQTRPENLYADQRQFFVCGDNSSRDDEEMPMTMHQLLRFGNLVGAYNATYRTDGYLVNKTPAHNTDTKAGENEKLNWKIYANGEYYDSFSSSSRVTREYVTNWCRDRMEHNKSITEMHAVPIWAETDIIIIRKETVRKTVETVEIKVAQ